MNLNETNVAQHYNQGNVEYELVQLQHYSPVKLAMTSRYLH